MSDRPAPTIRVVAHRFTAPVPVLAATRGHLAVFNVVWS